MIYWLLKHVTPTLTITASLSVTSGPAGTAFNVVVNSMNGTTPDANDSVSVLVTAPDKTTSTLNGTTDANGNATIPTTAGTQSGAYTYAVSVGGEAGPTLTFTKSFPENIPILRSVV